MLEQAPNFSYNLFRIVFKVIWQLARWCKKFYGSFPLWLNRHLIRENECRVSSKNRVDPSMHDQDHGNSYIVHLARSPSSLFQLKFR